MAIHPIYRRRFSNLEITVWNARDGYDEDLSVKIANRHRSTKPFSTFSLKDLQAASLLLGYSSPEARFDKILQHRSFLHRLQ